VQIKLHLNENIERHGMQFEFEIQLKRSRTHNLLKSTCDFGVEFFFENTKI